MPIFAALLIWSAATATATGGLPPVDGELLPVGDACYTVPGSEQGKSAGSILRRVERIDDKRWMITIASRFNGGPLLTSRIEVAFPSLRPIRTIEETDGETNLSVRYRDGKARGMVRDEDGRRQTSEVPLSGPVWDDETIEFVLTALPLADGAHFDLPVFHFGRGPGVARIDVRHSISPEGFSRDPIAAWEIEASTRSDMTIIFLVAKADRRLLAVEVAGVRSVLGGDCSGLIR
ncbi:DUF3108 domain-containing protein [Sphingomonas asaccharolytica]|uniref:DUF3108 domain-containing protein n=1 Tax=Sphingomonas asaccharolytica TaxID=40681 RepID=UPI0008377A2D|nr:hypothetical protein [Sphingomonas asaccharolytica]